MLAKELGNNVPRSVLRTYKASERYNRSRVAKAQAAAAAAAAAAAGAAPESLSMGSRSTSSALPHAKALKKAGAVEEGGAAGAAEVDAGEAEGDAEGADTPLQASSHKRKQVCGEAGSGVSAAPANEVSSAAPDAVDATGEGLEKALGKRVAADEQGPLVAMQKNTGGVAPAPGTPQGAKAEGARRKSSAMGPDAGRASSPAVSELAPGARFPEGAGGSGAGGGGRAGEPVCEGAEGGGDESACQQGQGVGISVEGTGKGAAGGKKGKPRSKSKRRPIPKPKPDKPRPSATPKVDVLEGHEVGHVRAPVDAPPGPTGLRSSPCLVARG